MKKNINAPMVTFKDTPSHLEVSCKGSVRARKESDGRYSAFLIGFDIHFSANSEEDIKKKARALNRIFFDHYLLHEKKNGLKKLALELHKLGFKSDNPNALHSLVNQKGVSAKFKSNLGVPEEFEQANEYALEESALTY